MVERRQKASALRFPPHIYLSVLSIRLACLCARFVGPRASSLSVRPYFHFNVAAVHALKFKSQMKVKQIHAHASRQHVLYHRQYALLTFLATHRLGHRFIALFLVWFDFSFGKYLYNVIYYNILFSTKVAAFHCAHFSQWLKIDKFINNFFTKPRIVSILIWFSRFFSSKWFETILNRCIYLVRVHWFRVRGWNRFERSLEI